MTTTNTNRMAHVTLRVPRDILEFYKKFPNPSVEMREVLTAYAKEKTGWA